MMTMMTQLNTDYSQYQDNIAEAMKMICNASLIRESFVIPRLATNLMLSQNSSVWGFDFYQIILKKADYETADTAQIAEQLQMSACRLERIGALKLLGTALLDVFPLINITQILDDGAQIRICFVISTREPVISYLLNNILGNGGIGIE